VGSGVVPELFEHLSELVVDAPGVGRIARELQAAIHVEHSKTNRFHVKRRDRSPERLAVFNQGLARRGFLERIESREQRVQFRQGDIRPLRHGSLL
jgi:hypothetical protein